jgi:hypothetical protein
MDTVRIGNLDVKRLIVGGNPFSGVSHHSPEKDLEMKRYYTVARLKETLRTAEGLGVDTFLGRTDAHIMRMLLEYWDEGGKIQWIAQTAPELGAPQASVGRAASAGAKACFIHGGVMDYLLAQGKLQEVPPVIDQIRAKGMLAGVAGHNPKVFEWADRNLDVDLYMCCYYNSARRDEKAEHVSGAKEWFRDEDRETMVRLIRTLSKPAIHYKIMAAGRNDPAEAFRFAAAHLRENDAVCVGVYTKDRPDMIAEDIRLLEEGLKTRPAGT